MNVLFCLKKVSDSAAYPHPTFPYESSIPQVKISFKVNTKNIIPIKEDSRQSREITRKPDHVILLLTRAVATKRGQFVDVRPLQSDCYMTDV